MPCPGGFQRGDVKIDQYGYLNVTVRLMKMRPEFKVHPGLISIPPPPDGDTDLEKGVGYDRRRGGRGR